MDVSRIPLRRRALYASFAAGVSLTASFGVLEAFARWREARGEEVRRAPPSLALMRENPRGTGSYRLKPNLDVATWVKGMRVRIRTNRFGMPWREVEQVKPPRQRRVAFQGDSFAFGCWTRDLEHGMVGVFESGLNRERIEVLNFAVGGYGLDDMELQLEEEVLDFAPDWVIVVLFVGNDFRDTWLGLEKHRVEEGTAVLREDVLAAKVPPAFVRAPWFSSPAAPDPSATRRALMRSAAFRQLLPALGLEYPWVDFSPCRKFTSFSFWSLVPPPEVALRARDALLGTLERMDSRARARGARLAVVTLPSADQVYARAETGRDFDVQLPQAWIRVWARERGLPCLDLWAKLREHARATQQRVYLPDDIHFGERGHALVGTWMREWFAAEVRSQERP